MMRSTVVGLAAILALAACSADRSAGEPLSGEALAADLGCLACHADVDTAIAPTLNGKWGASVELEDGTTVTVDEDYVRRSLEEPQADILAGYSASMPAVPMSDDEKSALVDYIESLG